MDINYSTVIDNFLNNKKLVSSVYYRIFLILLRISLIPNRNEKYITSREILDEYNKIFSSKNNTKNIVKEMKSGLDEMISENIIEKQIVLSSNKKEERFYLVNIDEPEVEYSSSKLSKDKVKNVFREYEENIGLLTPLIFDELKQAIERYPESWICDAIKIAVEYNRRHWRYIQQILKSWELQGKKDGKLKGNIKTSDRIKYFQEYSKKRETNF